MVSVLYVDDERDLLELGKIFLEQSPEFNVALASSAKDALASPFIQSCDAIVSDYQMPEMDGIAFLKTVRERFGDVPFILFTGRGREDVVIEAINNGADFYLQKGGDIRAQFAELSNMIRQAVARRTAEHSLVESEKRLADIIDFLPDATFAINRDGNIIAWNHALDEMTGYPAGSMLGKGNHEYAIPFYGKPRPILIDCVFASDEQISPHYTRILRKGASLTAETNLALPRGNAITVLAKASPLYNRKGEIIGAIEVIRDITERKKAEDELRAAYEQITASDEELRGQLDMLAENEKKIRESEARLQYLLGFYEKTEVPEAELLGYAVEGAGVVTESPLGYLAFLNEDESELSMYSWSKFVMKGCAIQDKPLVYETAKTGLWGEAVRQRCPVITNDYSAPNPAKKGYPAGHPGIIRHMNVPIIDGGHVVLVAGVANKLQDYTGEDVKQLSLLMQGLWQVIKQRRIKHELAKSEENYRTIINGIQDVFYRSDTLGNLIMASPSITELLGYDSLDEVIGKNIARVFWSFPEQRQKFIDELEKHGSVKNFEAVLKRKDGRLVPVSTSSHFYYTKDGSVAGIEGILHDVSEYHTMEEAVRNANHKLNLLSSITRHDIINQLTILQGFAVIAAMEKGNPVIADYIARIIAAADIIARQIEFTRTYQELGVKAPVWNPVGTVIRHVDSRVPVTFSNTCSGIEIFADPMLERVFFNLFDNAVRHGARVTEITVRCEREPEGMVIIVEDNGTGIDALEKESIFERGVGKNTGLGLFLVREILSITGLTIRETGIPGTGARFEITVPKGKFRFTG